MKKTFITAIALTALAFPSIASADEDRYYVTVGAGNNSTADVEGDTTISSTLYDLRSNMDDSFVYQLGVVKHFSDQWRIEAAFAKAKPTMIDITASTGGVGATATISPNPEYDVKSYMVNIYRDFPGLGKELDNGTKFYPYIGAGLGQSNVKMQTYTTTVAGTDVAITDDGRDLFTWNLKGGLNYKMNDTSDLYAEATYTKLESFAEDGINNDAVGAVNIIGGLRYKF